MNTLLSVFVLFSFSAPVLAAPEARFSCIGRMPLHTAVYLEGNLDSSRRLSHVVLKIFGGSAFLDQREQMEGISDASNSSPLQGTRFYFHSGNTSTFLLLGSKDQAGVRAILSASDAQIRSAIYDKRFEFHLAYVFEGYEQGGFRESTDLLCGPKAVGD